MDKYSFGVVGIYHTGQSYETQKVTIEADGTETIRHLIEVAIKCQDRFTQGDLVRIEIVNGADARIRQNAWTDEDE